MASASTAVASTDSTSPVATVSSASIPAKSSRSTSTDGNTWSLTTTLYLLIDLQELSGRTDETGRVLDLGGMGQSRKPRESRARDQAMQLFGEGRRCGMILFTDQDHRRVRHLVGRGPVIECVQAHDKR